MLGTLLRTGSDATLSPLSFELNISSWKTSHLIERLAVRQNKVQLLSQLFLVGLSEELYFRGNLVTSLAKVFSKKTMGIHSAALTVALGFAGVQFYKLIFGGSLAAILPFFAGALLYGIVLGEMYLRTKSLLASVLIHNLGNSLLFLASLGL